MCLEPDFDLPDSLVDELRVLEACADSDELTVKHVPDSAALVKKIAEQTGFSASTVATALLNEGIAAFRLKGILF